MPEIQNFLKKPAHRVLEAEKGRFEKFSLKENPFPSSPIVNKDSDDNRINGNIFEMSIRTNEYEQIKDNFLNVPQSDPNHLRLGYVMDTSYIGRGNGKSAFFINVQKEINRNYCLDLSGNANKCFGVYFSPEPSGRTKTFDKIVDLIFEGIVNIGIIEYSLATLRLEAILQMKREFNLQDYFENTEDLVNQLNSADWFQDNNIDLNQLMQIISQNKHIAALPPTFPLPGTFSSLFPKFPTQDDFKDYYSQVKKPAEKLEFVFSHLVDFFRAANFNGAYVFIDDFERVPDFQSARQRKDFAIELRTCLFDGIYSNAKIGFYNFLLVLHAGVPRLMQDAWAEAGMEHRASLIPHESTRHIVKFEKLASKHAILLVKKYLDEYRINQDHNNELFPFTEKAIIKIGESSEFNAAKILKTAYEILDRIAVPGADITIIDENVATRFRGKTADIEDRPSGFISKSPTVDLFKKAKGKE